MNLNFLRFALKVGVHHDRLICRGYLQGDFDRGFLVGGKLHGGSEFSEAGISNGNGVCSRRQISDGELPLGIRHRRKTTGLHGNRSPLKDAASRVGDVARN